eukprot:TRINITY_DN25045_c0_g1_i1.p1 TRINITY_DN25045_c0_g1~~TRINITY_DN25045_c0_g1_i1.p1  ORF type:complete len:351 (+),score=63.00 TRINITY_DN25045_c0_g1_i1:77-1129(+)
MDIFLNYKNPRHTDLYRDYLEKAGSLVSNLRFKLAASFLLTFLAQVTTRIAIGGLNDAQKLNRVIYVSSTLIMLLAAYLFVKKYSGIRRRSYMLLNVIPPVMALPFIIMVLTEARDLVQDSPDRIKENFHRVVGAVVFSDAAFMICHNMIPFFIWAIALFICFIGIYYGLLIHGNDSIFWLDIVRLVIIVVFSSGFRYLEEKSKKEIVLRTNELLEEETKWRTLMKEIPEGIVAFDEKLEIQYDNYAVGRIFLDQDELGASTQLLKQRIEEQTSFQPERGAMEEWTSLSSSRKGYIEEEGLEDGKSTQRGKSLSSLYSFLQQNTVDNPHMNNEGGKHTLRWSTVLSLIHI